MKTCIKLLLAALFLSSCVQETHLKTVTFQVDMKGIENVSDVGIRGSFTPNQWTETVPLTDEDGDSIYEGTFSQKTAINQFQFKFVNQNEDYELKGKDNRVLVFKYEPETIIYKGVFNDETKVEITKK